VRGIEGEPDARKLLRRAKLARHWFLKRQGLQASEQLQQAARRGDLNALRVLAGPATHPDRLFSVVWRDLLSSQRAASSLLRKHVGRRYELGFFAYGRQDDVARDLAELVRHPAADVLTANMRRIVPVAASLHDHPIAEIAQRKILAADDQGVIDEVCELAEFVRDLASFCREHELTPSDSARRPAFWLLTGQYGRYRSADPYGSAALSAYAAGDTDTRARLRTAAIEGGFFELLRRLAEHDGEFADLLRGEQFIELSQGLAARERWSLLWELLAQVPVAVAVERSQLFPAEWRPGSTVDQSLLAALRAAPVAVVSAAAEDPHLLNLVRFEQKNLLVGFGRSRAAVFDRTANNQLTLDVYDLPGGELRHHGEYDAERDPFLATVCGDSTVIACDRQGVWCYRADDRVQIADQQVGDLVATATGWAALSWDHLFIGTSDGQLTYRLVLADLGVGRDEGSTFFASSADGTRLALANEEAVVVLDQDGRTLSTTYPARPEPIHAIGFLGADVITLHQRWDEQREYQIRDYGDNYEAWDDVTVHVSWHLANDTCVLEHAEEFEDTDSDFPSYTTNFERDRHMRRDHTDPGPRGTPVTAREHPVLEELPSTPARVRITTSHATVQLTEGPEVEKPPWISTRVASLVPGTLLLAKGDDHELRLYDLRREYDVRRAAVLAQLNQPIPELRDADLPTDDDACLRVLRACRDWAIQTGPARSAPPWQ
jgi:hypothetical protein